MQRSRRYLVIGSTVALLAAAGAGTAITKSGTANAVERDSERE